MDMNAKHYTQSTRATLLVVQDIANRLMNATIADLAGPHEISIIIKPIPEDVKKISDIRL